MLFRFLLIFLAVLVVYRAVRRLFLPSRRRGEVPRGAREVIHKGEMVKDPVCGTYVPRDGSLSLRERGGEHFFCSPACRDAFQAGGRSAS
jgi:YHS domain-containing protein